MVLTQHRHHFVSLRPLAALCVIAALTGCSSEAPVQTSAPIRPAKLIEITAASDIQTAKFPAIIEAATSSQLTFQVGGLLQELPVIEGDEIAEGTVIARLDQRDFQNDLATAQAQFDSAEADFRRTELLLKEGAVSESVYDQQKTARDVASASLDTARKRLDDATLRSPFDGVVATVHIEQYQNVSPQEPIVTLQTTGPAEAAIQVPSRLVVNSERFVPIEAIVVLDAAPDARIPAEFKSAATQADPTTQTFIANFVFTPPTELVILPGMTGTVQLQFRIEGEDSSDEQTTLPLSAILSDGETRYVWLVDTGTMTVSRRDIEVASGIGETLRLLSGLKAADTIVGAGASYLHEGMQIRRYEQ